MNLGDFNFDSSAIDKAKSALQKEAYKTSKEFLTNINEGINSAVSQMTDPLKNIGAVYQNSRKKKDEVKEPPRFGNEYPVLFGGYGVNINNVKLGVERLAFITELSITQNEGTSSTCTMKISDPNFYFIEDSLFIRETPIQASITLLGDFTKMVFFDGYIATVDIEFPSDGCPKLTINCIDKSHEMTRVKYKRSWENVTSSQVVQQIAQEHGFACYVEEGYPFPLQATIVQDDKTDIEFLEDLASKELDLFECHLVTNTDGKTILYYVIKGKIDQDNYTSLTYRFGNIVETGPQQEPSKRVCYDIVSFKPNINIETRQEEVRSDGINADTKEVESAEVSVSEPSEEGNSSSSSSSSSNSGSSDDRVSYDY